LLGVLRVHKLNGSGKVRILVLELGDLFVVKLLLVSLKLLDIRFELFFFLRRRNQLFLLVRVFSLKFRV
jgi:hypothetical protein